MWQRWLHVTYASSWALPFIIIIIIIIIIIDNRVYFEYEFWLSKMSGIASFNVLSSVPR